MVIKRRFHFFKAFLTLAIIFLMVALGAFSSQSVSAQGPTPTPSLPSDLTAQLAQQGATISTHAQTGLAHFITADPNRPIRPSAALPANPSRDQVARGFLDQFGKLFGVSNQSQELIVAQQKTPDNRRAFVRFQQVYQGVPVFGGELNVQVTAANAVTSANGEISPKLSLSTTPTITAATARQSALDAVAKSYKLASASLTATTPQLWIYDPTLVGPDSGPVRLVWRMDVSSTGLPPILELVLVDAQTGGIELHFNQISTSGSAGSPAGKAPTRKITATDNASHAASAALLNTPLISVYTMNGLDSDTGTLPGTLLCTESNPTACDSDVDAQKAYQYAVATYNFYASYLGRDSIDGQGMRIISSVHFGVGYRNAFWNGSQMVYGDGFSLADDVVGHELTHGVTQHESHLFHFYQAGSINESMSDVFGEFVDQTDGLGTDTLAVKWLMGEDLPSSIAIVRDMKNPPNYGQPDKMTSPNYDTSDFDYGGVHQNDGINNKAAYLMTDGDAFNGQTVTGLGIAKVASIYYEVQTNLLTSGADYADLYDDLYQGCLNLVGTSGITSGDCQQVRNATNAVQMNQQPVAGYNPDAAVCATGQTPSNLFYDTFENGYGNWSLGAVSGLNQWTTADPWGLGPNAHSGTNVLYADNSIYSSSSYAAMVNGVTLPTNAYLHFYHHFDLEWPYDGGIVEYSANGGPWVNAGSLMDSGQGYTGTVASLGSIQGFTGTSHGYVSTRLNLNSLAGKNVKFRWRLGTNDSVYYYGWWLDDVQIYTCLPPTVTSFTPASGPQGTTVTITGTHFTSATAVKFNGTSASFSLVSDTKITATVPAGATTGKISITTPSGTATSAASFTVITAPAIDVQGPEPTAIADGGVYNMGTTTIGNHLVKAITVNNPGTQALTLLTNPPTVTGAGFSAGPFGAVSVAPGGSTTFTLTCNATAGGSPVSGTVSFANNVSAKNPFNFTVNCQVLLPPADAPTALTATALSQTSINVAWNDNSSVETAYKIERSPDGTTGWTEIGSVGANVTSYQDTLLDCDTTYVYRVRAYRSSDGAYSLYSNADGATTAACTLVDSPTLLAPDNGSLTKNNAPTFTWTAVTGADSYQIQIDDSDDFSSPVQSSTVTGLSYTASTLVDGTTYSWRVRGLANSNSETGPWSTAWSVSIDQKRLPAPALSAPANNTNIAITMPTFTWLAVTGATQYELQVDVDPAFASLPVDHTLGNVTKYVATADNLQYGSTYYWRVRASAATTLWSNWSSVRSFSLTIMKSPTNGAYVVSHNQAVSWSPVAGAHYYDLQISPDSDFSSGFWGSFGGVQATIIGIPWDQYYWRVNVTTNAGTSPWMAAWRLTVTPTLPAAPTLIDPAANVPPTNNTAPFFSWNPTTTADGWPFDYQIQITRGTSFYNPVQDVRQNITDYIADPLLDGVYSWRVRAINNVNTAGPWSVVRSFTIDTTPPAAPVLTVPKDWSSITATRPAFSWSAAPGAKYYRLSMFSGDDCSAPTWLWDSPNQTALSYTPALGQALTVGSSYCWQVTAGDAADNWGAPSAFFHLTVSSGVVPAPGVPTLLKPDVGSPWPDSGLPDFKWSMATTGNFFEIQIATAPTFASPARDDLTATDQYIYTPPLSSLAAGVYSWRVRAINSGRVAGAWSATRTFTVTSLVPGAPILLTPANGASTTLRNPALTWQAVSGAKSYNVQVSQYTDFHSPVVNKTGAVTTSYTPIAGEALSYGTTYYWHVQAVNAGGTVGNWSQTFTLTASVHKTPLDGSSTKTVKPTFAWVAVTGATYTLQYATDPGFGPGSITVTPTGTQYTLPTGLAPNKYYWRVQVTVGGVPTMMPAWTLYVATTIPIAPTLTDPANNAATNDNTPTFAWKPVTGGQTYEVQIDDLSTFASPQQDGTTAIGALSYTANPLADGKYYWRARAIGSTGAPGPWSAAWTVTIDTAPPATPLQTGPFNGTTITNPQLTLRWNASAGAATYEVHLYTVDLPLTPPIPNGAALTYKPVAPLAYGTYYWQVRALDAVGNVSDWSPAESFSVVAGMSIAAPRLTPTPATATPIQSGKVTLLTPTGATATEHPTYTWTADAQATKYYLVVSGPTGAVVGQWFDSTICSNGVCQATPAAPALTNGRYTFWVETWIGGSLGSWSDSLSFAVTNQTPAMAVQLGPVGLLTTTPATFSWRAATNAQSYYLVVQKADGTQLLSQWYDGAQVCSGDTCSVTPALNLTNGVYTWWVTTWGGGVLGAPSAGLMFTVNGVAPATPAPTVPVAPTFVPNTN